ncbi:MAG: hypothetical protein GY816_18135 [Cytophagales bacterium]|nr:hypothetical protein [Cytophagales bacterium]
MEDNKIWFYIIAAVIYFLTRRKKKKNQPQPESSERPKESNRPQQQKKPVSFEDLLKEITEGRADTVEPEVIEEKNSEPVYEEALKEEPTKKERIRHFADDESRRIYEESVARAAEFEPGHDHKFEPDDDYVSKKMFKGLEVETEPTLADEIRESLQTTDSARKAIIYSEILNKKY